MQIRTTRPSVEELETRVVPAVDPLLSTWLEGAPALLAQVISQFDPDAGPSTTWPDYVPTGDFYDGGTTIPLVGDIHKISFTDEYVFVSATPGVATFIMGPWYLDSDHDTPFPNFPSDQNLLVRITRSPQIETGDHTSTPLGEMGLWVNGVSMYNMLDGYSWDDSAMEDSTSGDGYWNRNANVAEEVTFDFVYGHTQMGGEYHNHANPLGLRAQLGDNIAYTGTIDLYPYDPHVETHDPTHEHDFPFEENTGDFHHSPILGWSFDGFPVYGPYGYSDPMDPTSPIRRMNTSYQDRDITQRTSLPGWAAQALFGEDVMLDANGEYPLTADLYGPDVSDDYPIGDYVEDFEYIAGLGDLDKYNGRFTVTPEYPNGIYAYFITIDDTGDEVFPYAIGRQYAGVFVEPDVSAIDSSATVLFDVSAPRLLAVGADEGAAPQVNVYDSTGSLALSFLAYDEGFRGGVRVATGDMTGDGIPDIITAAGMNGNAHIKVFDGTSGDEIRSFLAFDGFSGGAFAATGDVNGDGHVDLIVGTDSGSSHVKVFDGLNNDVIHSFFAFPGFAGGVRVASGDLNKDGADDLITGAGPGAGPHIRAFDGLTGDEDWSYFAFDGGFLGGVYVAVGDVNGDGYADVIVGAGQATGNGAPIVDSGGSGPGPGGLSGANVRVFSGQSRDLLVSFFAYTDFHGGVRVGALDFSGNGLADLLTGNGSGSGPNIRVIDESDLLDLDSFFAFETSFLGGVFVG